MATDLLNELASSSINIYGSRERIRGQLIENAKKYLHLEGIGENIYKTSLLAYIIDTLSILSANQLFYDTAIYREFFMVDAQMQESVYNLARWVGYKVPRAVPSTVSLIFEVPLTFDGDIATFNIPKNFKAKAGEIEFLVDLPTTVAKTATFHYDKAELLPSIKNEITTATNATVINNTALSVIDGNGYMRPVYYDWSNKKKPIAAFSLPFKQHKRIVIQFLVPAGIQQYQFFSKELTFDGMVSDIKVWVAESIDNEKFVIDNSKSNDFDPYVEARTINNDTVPWVEWQEAENGLYTMASDSKQFIFTGGDGKGEVFFGNGIVGKQLPGNSAVTIELFVTEGQAGNVLPLSINNGDKIEYIPWKNSKSSSALASINYKIYNPVSPSGAVDILTLPEIKQNAIINLRTKGRLVSEGDYDDINIVAGDRFPSVEAFPILKRSDIKINEILTFVRLLYSDEYSLPQIVPTRNIKVKIPDETGHLFNSDYQYSVMRSSRFSVDNELYQTIFNMTLDKRRMIVMYDYVAKGLYGTPAALYANNISCFYNEYVYAPINGIDFQIEFRDEQENPDVTEEIVDGSKNYPLNITVHLNHIPLMNQDEDLQTKLRCRMITKWGDNNEYIHDPNEDWNTKIDHFSFTIPNYLEVPENTQRFEFYIDVYGIKRDTEGHYLDSDGKVIDASKPGELQNKSCQAWMPLKAYYCDVVIRKNLDEVMLSELTKEVNGKGEDVYVVHNVPAILSEYVDKIDAKENGQAATENAVESFELTVLQTLINNLELSDKRMLTDFINIKFPDTHGTLNNLKYNPVDHVVYSRTNTPFSNGYIVQGTEYKYIANNYVPGYSNKELSEYINCIAEWYDSAKGEAVIELLFNDGVIRSITVNNPGSEYTNPTITISDEGGTGTGARAIAEINTNGEITAVKVTRHGKNYSKPIITITDSLGHDARLTAVVTDGVIVGCNILNPGVGFEDSSIIKVIDKDRDPEGQFDAIIKITELYDDDDEYPRGIKTVEIIDGGSGYNPETTTASAYNGVWYLRRPERGEYVKVLDELDVDGYPKLYFYDGNTWVDSESFKIPLTIKLKVEVDPRVTATSSQIADNIKYELIYHFNPLMGIQRPIDRSEIISVVRGVAGVRYCELLDPAIDIRFKYNIKDLMQKQLIDYTPQYIGFTEDNIEVVFGKI